MLSIKCVRNGSTHVCWERGLVSNWINGNKKPQKFSRAVESCIKHICVRSASTAIPASRMDTSTEPAEIPMFRSCLEECSEPIVTEITGKLPSWLNGVLIRNGAGLRTIGDTSYKHAFDGMSLLHQFTIRGKEGKVFYRNRFLRTETYKKNMKANRIIISEFGTRAFPDPCKSLYQRFMSYFSYDDWSDNANVSIVPVGDEVYACTETPFVTKIDPNTIETIGRVDVTKYITVNTQTAHPHIEEDKTVLNLGSAFGKNSSYKVIKTPPDGSYAASTILASIPVKHQLSPSYYHSFSVTENYIVFVEQPLVISIPKIMMTHFVGGDYSHALKWKPLLKTNFHLVSRKTGKIVDQKYESEPFAFFHTINAFEENGSVHVDICCYPDGKIVKALFRESMTDQTGAKKIITYSEARRYSLPLPKDEVTTVHEKSAKITSCLSHQTSKKKGNVISCPPDVLSTEICELPRINYERNNGKSYRYFYSVSFKQPLDPYWLRLMKFDTETRTPVFWQHEDHWPSEPVFIQNPSGTHEEDDGVVISAVLDQRDERNGYMLVLDAKSFKELARCKFRTPSAITTDFHGHFFPQDIPTQK